MQLQNKLLDKINYQCSLYLHVAFINRSFSFSLAAPTILRALSSHAKATVTVAKII